MNEAAKQSYVEAARKIIDDLIVVTTVETSLTISPLPEVGKNCYLSQLREELLVWLTSFALENELDSIDKQVN